MFYLLKALFMSSLHCNISLSFCLFFYNGVCFEGLKLSVDDTIISQKRFQGDRKLHFFGHNNIVQNENALWYWPSKQLKNNQLNMLHYMKRIQNITKIVECRLFHVKNVIILFFWLQYFLESRGVLDKLILWTAYCKWTFINALIQARGLADGKTTCAYFFGPPYIVLPE